MRAKIHITGAIFGNSTIANKLKNYTERKNGMFNSVYLYYETKAKAQKDLSKAYKKLIEDEPESKRTTGIYRHNGRAYKLNYDASSAEIIDIN